MTATENMARLAKKDGKSLKNQWQQPWSNFTDVDVHESCVGKPNYDECVADMRKRPNYEGDGGKFFDKPWVQTGSMLLGDLLSGIGSGQYGQNNQNQFGQNQFGQFNPNVPPRQGMSTGTKVVIGVLVVGAIGTGIYFALKNKK